MGTPDGCSVRSRSDPSPAVLSGASCQLGYALVCSGLSAVSLDSYTFAPSPSGDSSFWCEDQ